MKNKMISAAFIAAAFAAGAFVAPKLGHSDSLSIRGRNGGISVDLNDHDHHRHHHHWLHHEQIDAALGQLNAARDHLVHASNDFGGHRARALRLLDKVIGECHASVDYANSHEQ